MKCTEVCNSRLFGVFINEEDIISLELADALNRIAADCLKSVYEMKCSIIYDMEQLFYFNSIWVSSILKC